MLVDSEGLASDGGLINLEESVFGDNATISGNDGTLLDLEDITGNDERSLNLLEGTVTEDDSLESESLLQLVDNRTSLELLDETDSGVKQKQTANDTEIDPILETSSEDGSSLLQSCESVNCIIDDLNVSRQMTSACKTRQRK